MSRFLRFPNTSVSRVGKGPALAEEAAIEMHVTEPLGPKEPIPNKTGLQKVVERPDQRVIDSRAAKEKKRQATQPRVASKKRPSVDPSHRPHKRGHTSSIMVSEDDGSSDGDRTRSPSPLNISHPEDEDVGDENVEHTEDVDDVEDTENVEDVEVLDGENAGNTGGVNLESGVENVAPENVDGNPEGDGIGLDVFATDPDEDLGGPNVSNLAHGGTSDKLF